MMPFILLNVNGIVEVLGEGPEIDPETSLPAGRQVQDDNFRHPS
jgi:hypothetical protein